MTSHITQFCSSELYVLINHVNIGQHSVGFLTFEIFSSESFPYYQPKLV